MGKQQNNSQFDEKWSQTLKRDVSEEFTVFVEKGAAPTTQRQLFLYQYYTYIRRMFGDKKILDTLEVGCGRGTVSLYFNVYEGSNITLTDVSEGAIDLAKKNIAYHHGRGTAFVASADSLPLGDDGFDLVFSIGLLEHMDEYDQVVREKYRVLRTGGMVASLNIPKKPSIQALNTAYRSIVRLLGGGAMLKKDYYRNNHTPEMFRKAFERAGFTDIVVVYMTPFPLFTPLPRSVEHVVTLLYRAMLYVRSFFMRHPFVTNRFVAQAHMITARKP